MSSSALITNSEIMFLSLEEVKPNPYQPRRFFDSKSLEELSKSIREYGILQPISVRLIQGYSYELVAGERRLRASKLAGLETIPAIVININDQDSSVLAIIENLQRQNLNYLEEAEGFLNLIQDHSFTQEQLAEKIGKSQSTIANKLRILKLSKGVQTLLIQNNLTERHARALLRLEDEAMQIDVIHKIIKQGLTVKKTEDLIEFIINKNKQDPKENKQNFKVKHFVKDIRLFTNTVKQSVDIMKSSGAEVDFIMEEIENGCEILIKVEF
jgi:ParB family transcriptional regulator, chromosome partitioning protein